MRGAEIQRGGAHRVQVDQGAKLGVGANARNVANSADGHRSYALADTESDSHKEETISKTSASLHVGWIRVGCFLLWSVWEPTPAEPALATSWALAKLASSRDFFFKKNAPLFFQCGSRLCGSSFDQCHATASS